MSSDLQQIRIGLTNCHQCSYLADKQERVAVALDPTMHYWLQVMKSCWPMVFVVVATPSTNLIVITAKLVNLIVLSVPDFVISKNQKRLLKKPSKHTFGS